MDNQIIVYTIGCPKCQVLEKKLKQKQIPFQTCDDLEIMREKGFKMAPMMEVDGKVYDFNAALKYLRDIEKAV